MKGFGVPLLVTGGGGYTKHNVARCWTFETALLCGQRGIPEQLPSTDYNEYFAPDYLLRVHSNKAPLNIPNLNTPEYIESVKIAVFENLRHLKCAPGVSMDAHPPAHPSLEYSLDGLEQPEQRVLSYCEAHLIPTKEAELYEDDRDNWGD